MAPLPAWLIVNEALPKMNNSFRGKNWHFGLHAIRKRHQKSVVISLYSASLWRCAVFFYRTQWSLHAQTTSHLLPGPSLTSEKDCCFICESNPWIFSIIFYSLFSSRKSRFLKTPLFPELFLLLSSLNMGHLVLTLLSNSASMFIHLVYGGRQWGLVLCGPSWESQVLWEERWISARSVLITFLPLGQNLWHPQFTEEGVYFSSCVQRFQSVTADSRAAMAWWWAWQGKAAQLMASVKHRSGDESGRKGPGTRYSP